MLYCDGECDVVSVDGLNDTVTQGLSVIYEWISDDEGQAKGRFEVIQSLAVSGARDWTHFTVDSYHFLVVASARHDSSSLSLQMLYSIVYLWQSGRFVPFQTIEVCHSTHCLYMFRLSRIADEYSFSSRHYMFSALYAIAGIA